MSLTNIHARKAWNAHPKLKKVMLNFLAKKEKEIQKGPTYTNHNVVVDIG